MYCKYCATINSEDAKFCSSCGKSLGDANNRDIANRDALVRRANKMVREFDQYPLMPRGNLTLDFIRDVFNFNPLFVLDDLKHSVLDMLLEQTEYAYEEEELLPILEETYGKQEQQQKERILNILIDNFKKDLEGLRFRYWKYMNLRPDETVVFYYAFSVFYIARELHNDEGLLFARKTLRALHLFQCEKDDGLLDSIRHTGELLTLSEFSEDREIYIKLLRMIENEIQKNASEECKQQLAKEKQEEEKSASGCYVATCVYGSYDCPQVWTLRRYRDDTLGSTWYGRLFIRTYYAISPTLVKWFGNTNWFKKLWKGKLDRMVAKLQSNGVEDTPYEDKNW